MLEPLASATAPTFIAVDETAHKFTISTTTPADIGIHQYKVKVSLVNDPTVSTMTTYVEIDVTCTVTAVNLIDTANIPSLMTYFKGATAVNSGFFHPETVPSMCPSNLQVELSRVDLLTPSTSVVA